MLKNATPTDDVVITGIGVVSPLAIGVDETFQALLDGRSGVGVIERFATEGMAVRIGSEVKNFSVKPYVNDRKRVKLLSLEMQHGFAAAKMAAAEANVDQVDPDRIGVVFGMEDLLSEPADMEAAVRHCIVDGEFRYELWGADVERFIAPIVMLRYLPNMAASHISIELDARGPCNTIVSGGVSAFVAVSEAAHLVRRGVSDVVITGGASSRVNPEMWIRNIYLGSSQRNDQPSRASRPFDRHRDGMVNGEGGAAFVLESERHAKARGAKILGRLLGERIGFGCPEQGPPKNAIAHCIEDCLGKNGVAKSDVAFVNAHGLSTQADDRAEAEAIAQTLGETPVTAPKSNFANLGGGGAAVELAMAMAALSRNIIPPTLNYDDPDPACPIQLVHNQPTTHHGEYAIALSHAITGQASAILIARP